MKSMVSRVIRVSGGLSLLGLLSGCGGADVEGGEDALLGASQQEVTARECTEQLSACVRAAKTPFALVACNGAYAGCLAESAREVTRLPSQVTDAVDALAGCTGDFTVCVRSVSSPAELVACQEAQLSCAGEALGVPVDVSAGTDGLACVDGASECVKAAKSVAELTVCAADLTDCAGTVVDGIVPDEVVSTIGDVEGCAASLRACVGAADRPSELVACQEANAGCVGDALGVPLPNVGEAVGCAETAAQCVLDARSASEIAACAEGLTDCTGVTSGGTVPIIDCEVEFTKCTALNPFNVLQCAEEARQCRFR